MAELVFFSGTMDCGKSTLALQMDHNHRQRGRSGLLFSCNDRAGVSVISSRLGPRSAALEVDPQTDLWAEVVGRRTRGERIDYLICDEVQFYAAAQIEQLARTVDEMNVDVFAFGIATDFQTRLFPGSQRLIELADRVQIPQLEALCWCGRRATQNARTVDGAMVVEGAQVAVGDVEMGLGADVPGGGVADDGTSAAAVGYETLCRRHYMRRITAHSASLAGAQEPLLPFDVAG
ncbi:thymidine kinase [Arthrobacter sp. H14-L1]|uniref:thymidine kinase n=1 Tax=Arthrobacter sp. H14-L1 TaxID=2996697 RepID=UPI0022701A67|nr:thymidine kinase [Arthrobacter sp. H14-L1]MCY0904297.1 thymidine kinase [Arthrobacter sp. H14-L1]